MQYRVNELRAEQRRLRAVIKATHKPEDSPTNSKPKRNAGIRLATRQIVMDAVRELRDEHGNHDFTMVTLKEQIWKSSKLAESSINRAVAVLREEGFVRKIGKEGQAPLYRWVAK
jgi:hypothetical protein